MFFFEFSRIAPLRKDSALSEEQEWRAVSQMIPFNHPQMRTRPAGSTLSNLRGVNGLQSLLASTKVTWRSALQD
jgi:hypothetical protein